MAKRRGHCGGYGCTICTARTLGVGLLLFDETVSAARLMRHYPSEEVDAALADLTAGGYLERTVWGDYRLPAWMRAALGEEGLGHTAPLIWALLAEPQLPPWPGL